MRGGVEGKGRFEGGKCRVGEKVRKRGNGGRGRGEEEIRVKIMGGW